MSRARLLPLALACAIPSACVMIEPPDPLASADLEEITRESLLTIQSGQTLVGALDDDLAAVRRHDRHFIPPSGLAARLALLDAVSEEDRSLSIELLEQAADDAGDSLLEKTIIHLLEQDDAYLARQLESDRIYSVFAGIFNGLVQMGYAFLNANPIGVIKPLLQGADEVLGDGALDAGERKQLDLHRRWLVQHPDGEGLPDGADEVRERVADLQQQLFDEEVVLTERLLEEKNLDAAAAHVHSARTRRPDAKEVGTMTASLEALAVARSERLARGLRVEPLEGELILGDAELLGEYRKLVDGILLREATIMVRFLKTRDRAVASGRLDLVEALDRAERALRPDTDLTEGVEWARQDYSARVRRYIFTGRRISDDPLQRYRVAREEAHRTLLDFLEPIFWIPATLVRSIYASFGSPVDDQRIVDALARYVWNEPDEADRAAALAELSERYEDRNESDKALSVARLLEADPERIAELEEGVASMALRRAGAGAARSVMLRAIVSRFPRTEAAGEAREELTDILGDAYHGATIIPATAAYPLAEELGIDARLMDGRRYNGEIESPGLRYLEGQLLFEFIDEGVRERRTVDLEGDVRERIDALAAEWRWRRRAAATPTYRELHQGVPVELSAGIGPEGVGIYPRLMPEEYRSPDRKLFR